MALVAGSATSLSWLWTDAPLSTLALALGGHPTFLTGALALGLAEAEATRAETLEGIVIIKIKNKK